MDGWMGGMRVLVLVERFLSLAIFHARSILLKFPVCHFPARVSTASLTVLYQPSPPDLPRTGLPFFVGSAFGWI